MSSPRTRAPRAVCSSLLFVLLAAPTAPARADDLPRPLDDAAAVRLAVERSQAASAARASARASRALADAEGRLPDPEVMAEAWQIPVARPLALGDANMLMVNLRQRIPAPGSLSAREAAREAEARADDAVARDRARAVARDAAHAFVDLQVAAARHASHASHREVADRVLELARARLASGASRLSEVAQAEVERARLDADVELEAAMTERAAARLNGLLRRAPDAPIEPVPLGDPRVVGMTDAQVLALAAANRPETAATRARRAASDAAATAASREAKLPSFTVGAGWFAPTTMMPFHGYGVSVGASLPWIWGSARARARAGEASAQAAAEELGEIESRIRTEAVTALAEVRAAARRLEVLRARARPAARAALDVLLASYASGQTNADAVFRAEKDLVEIDVAVVDAHAALEHALVEVDWAAAARVPRAPLAARAPAGEGGAR